MGPGNGPFKYWRQILRLETNSSRNSRNVSLVFFSERLVFFLFILVFFSFLVGFAHWLKDPLSEVSKMLDRGRFSKSFQPFLGWTLSLANPRSSDQRSLLGSFLLRSIGVI